VANGSYLLQMIGGGRSYTVPFQVAR